jgi:hypothetical protein
MKIKKYHTVGTIPKSTIKNVERGKIDTTKKKEGKKTTLKNFEKHTGWLLTFVEVYI